MKSFRYLSSIYLCMCIYPYSYQPIFLGERAEQVRHNDNLQLEGQFIRREAEAWRAGDRADIVRREDNLR